MKKRLAVTCPNTDCGKTYETTFTLEGKPKLYVECPYCGTRGTITLSEHIIPQHTEIIRNTVKAQGIATTEAYDFPAFLPVEPLEDKK